MSKASDMAEIRESLRQTAKRNEELSKLIGEMGNKWGSYTEGLAAPAVARVLTEEFGAETVREHMAVTTGGESQEFDLIGVINGKKNEIVLAEIKSRLTDSEVKK